VLRGVAAVSAFSAGSDLARLKAALADLDPTRPAAVQLHDLVAAGLDRLPLPGGGATLLRWQALATVAEHDLSLAKLYESQTDALAILAELGAVPEATDAVRLWGVWAAEAPQGRTTFVPAGADPEVRLNGAKCWCSGAAGATHALLTAWGTDGSGPQLVAVTIAQPGVQVSWDQWRAVGMSGSASLDVGFRNAGALAIGRPGQYLSRPGFWQGGAGVAACWWGGAKSIAQTLRRSTAQLPPTARSPFRLAALGRIEIALESSAALLREAAAWVDAHPGHDASRWALRVRLAAEDCATLVLAEAGRALGATPYCRDARFAAMAADLPVFIRQSHAERDLAALGERTLDDTDAWPL
jgi:hypothetical protein